MQISPRYDAPPALRVDTGGVDVATPFERQRTRLAEALAGFDLDEWAAPSRCEGWSSQDVVSHLSTTNQFWTLSLTQALTGAPTRYLVGFDPVATPAQLVEGQRSLEPAAALDAFRASCEALFAVVRTIEGERWALPAEAPPGHVAASCVVLHALWDSWVHERDILLPLGHSPDEEPDEVAGSLRYAVALGPGFRASAGAGVDGAVGLHATDPDLRLAVELGQTVLVRDGEVPQGTPVVAGRSVDLLEALSLRQPFPPDSSPAALALLGGLTTVFDQD